MADMPMEDPLAGAPVAEPTPSPEAAPSPVAAPHDPNEVDIFDISGPNAVLGSVPSHQVTEAVASGKYSLPKEREVEVINPDGQLGTIPAEQAPQAFQNGYRYATQKDKDEIEFGSGLEQAKTIGQGVLKGALPFGLGTGVAKMFGAESERMSKREEVNPNEAMASEMAGFIAPSVLSGGLGAAAKAGVEGVAGAAKAAQAIDAVSNAGMARQFGEATAKALGMGGEGVGIAGKLAEGGVKMGAEMAMFQAGDEMAKAIQQDPHQTAQTAAMNIGMSSILGGALGAGTNGAAQLWKATAGKQLDKALNAIKNSANGMPNLEGESLNPAMKKAVHVLTGVSPEAQETYFANRAKIRALPTDEDLAAHIQDHLGKLNEAVSNGQLNAQEAQAAYKQAVSDQKLAYKEKGWEAKDAAKAAANDFKKAQDNLVKNVQDTAISQGAVAADAMEELRSKVINGSKEAYAILEQSGKEIPLDDMFSHGIDLVHELREKGTLESKQMASRLEEYLHQLPTEAVDAPKAKKLIQGLDAISKYDRNASAFNNDLAGQYAQLRHTLDATLKNAVPEYRAAMEPLASDARLLKELKKYGTPEAATSRINSLKNPVNYKNEMPLLKELENSTGLRFTDKIEAHANPEMVERMTKALPEYEQHQAAAAMEKSLRDPRVIQALKDAEMELPEYKALQKAQADKEAAIAARQELKGLTEGNVESQMRNAELGKPNAKRLLDKIPGMEGQSLPEMLKLRSAEKALSHGYSEGSRKVNMFGGLLGGLSGEVLGHALGGTAIGTLVGGISDKYGPQAVKALMDMYLDKFGNIGKMIGKEAGVSAPGRMSSQDAIRAAMARFLDKDAALTIGGKLDLGSAPSVEGFKSMVEHMDNLIKGERLIKNTAKSVFHPGVESVFPERLHPSERDIKTLEKRLDAIWNSQNPDEAVKHLGKASGNLGNYMPDHAEAYTEMATNVANYLKGQKPQTVGAGLLDTKPPLSSADKHQWERTLKIAQQPLTVLDHIKSGTLTPKDVVDFRSMFPALYSKVSQELMNGMMDASSKGVIIPYKTRLGASLFLGQAMDSTMTPTAIASAQPKPSQQPPQQAQNKPNKKNTSALFKMPASYKTPGQAREDEKQSGQ